MSIRILLADDHTVMRNGLRLLLERQHDLEVIGEAADGREAVELATSGKPDVVVMDIAMPHLNASGGDAPDYESQSTYRGGDFKHA